jgi:hypothetical protein
MSGGRFGIPRRRNRTCGLLPDRDPVWLEAVVLGVELGSSGEAARRRYLWFGSLEG